uniref:Uncharacterized protein n=1 Tax=Panagrolaimus sp. ES5 TaxID=591445 RepID=A0AC34FQD5_9BILA
MKKLGEDNTEEEQL